VSIFLLNDGKMFVHIPKNGGSSVRDGRCADPVARFYDPEPAWTYSESFAIIRDVYDRFESCYLDWRYNRKLTDLPPMEFLAFNFDRDVDNPGSAGHHLAPQWHPIHGIQHAQTIYHFDDYPFDRHLRTRPESIHVYWSKDLREMVTDYYSDDLERMNGL